MKKKTSILEDPIFQTLVGAIAAMVARITNLQVAGSYAEALDEIDQALEDLIGMKSNQLLGLTDIFILDLLTVNEYLDIQRLWYLAELIKTEGEIKTVQGLKSVGIEHQVRALGFFLETAFASGEVIPRVDDQIKALFDQLCENIPEDVLFNLYDYFDRQGNYKNAGLALDRMLLKTNYNAEIMLVKREFFRKLLEIPEEELSRGGLSISDINKR